MRPDRKGFVSLFFLTVLMLCTAVAGAVLANLCLRAESAENLCRANAYLGQESAVINAVQCSLKNSTLEDGDYEAAGTAYTLELTEEGAIVQIRQPLPETLILDFRIEEGILNDYETIRFDDVSTRFSSIR